MFACPAWTEDVVNCWLRTAAHWRRSLPVRTRDRVRRRRENSLLLLLLTPLDNLTRSSHFRWQAAGSLNHPDLLFSLSLLNILLLQTIFFAKRCQLMLMASKVAWWHHRFHCSALKPLFLPPSPKPCKALHLIIWAWTLSLFRLALIAMTIVWS